MQVRYQAALRPDVAAIIPSRSAVRRQQLADLLELEPQCRRIERTRNASMRGGCRRSRCARGGARLGAFGIEPMPRTVDREALLVEQVADPPDQQHFVMLVVAPVAAPLHRLQLREFLLPIPEHVRLHRTQVAHLADG